MFLAAVTLLALSQGRPYVKPESGPEKTLESGLFKRSDGKEVNVVLSYHWQIDTNGWGGSPDGQYPNLTCTNTCLGGKHAKHSECDLSCDTPCAVEHVVNLHGGAVKTLKSFTEILDRAANLWYGKGETNRLPYTSMTDIAYAQFDAEVAKLKPLLDYSGDVGHFASPCSKAIAGTLFRNFDVSIALTATVKDRAGKTLENEAGHTLFASIGYIAVPDPEAAVKSVGQFLKCACEIPKEKIEKPKDNPLKTATTSGVSFTTTDGNYLVQGNSTCTIDVAGCGNMNELLCTVTNHCDKDVVCEIGPGTLCVGPESDQRMMITEFNRKNIPAKKNFFASLGSFDWKQEPVTFKIQAICTQMHKDMPSDGAKFTILPTTPDGLANLGRVISDESIQGPWDQAMIWLWTDNSSLKETNDRLLLFKCPPAQFVWSLMNVATVGMKPLKDLQPFISPNYVMEWATKPAALKWLVRTEAELDPKGLASVVESNFGAMSDKLKADGPVSDIQHTADLIQGLCSSDDPSLQILGLRILGEVIPANDQFDVIRRGATDDLPLLLVSKDAGIKAKATEVASAYSAKIDSVNPNLSQILHAMTDAK